MVSEKNPSPPPGVFIGVAHSALDRSVSGSFRLEASRAIEGGTGPVVVDCSAVTFIDSSGVGALLHLNNLLPEERRPVVLLGASPQVLALLELLRVSHLFKLEQAG